VAISTELILNPSQQDELVAISQSRSLPAGYVFRAKLILMLAEGASFRTMGFFDYRPENHHFRLIGVTTRKCANCPVREAVAMLARSAIGAETRFSRCLKAAVYRKALFRDRK
jgi:hypothetical protein